MRLIEKAVVEGSRFLFCIVAAKRARQLGKHMVSRRIIVGPETDKPTTLAMEEVRRGLVPYVRGVRG